MLSYIKYMNFHYLYLAEYKFYDGLVEFYILYDAWQIKLFNL